MRGNSYRHREGGDSCQGLELSLQPTAVTIIGIELAHKIRKGQFDTSKLSLEKAQAGELWQAVLAA
jgi:hypothetical protein